MITALAQPHLIAHEGILLIDKPAAKTSFYLVYLVRKLTKIKKIGHCGTLDPFATGVMVMLIGKSFTRRSHEFLDMDKEYVARLRLGEATDTYDLDGQVLHSSNRIPSLEEVQNAITLFQGTIEQIPPMFSAKKINGKKLYELAREGKEIERAPSIVHLTTTLIEYHYPYLTLHVRCSKGTYIRSIAHDLGLHLGTYAHLVDLKRTKSGPFSIDQCISIDELLAPNIDYRNYLFR
ncbi:MAG: tRNA pseudouridine(55) synthase TruB [Simkaniaceae bacterium]|nr:tRNA pseudouridine(55) synthase TruB [Simkaniaceae bacterium]MCF7852924.1 tRNA pseudouridine(55) synthase TruB [Simkaniaceae bacterium]